MTNGTQTNIGVGWAKSFVERELVDDSVLHREGIGLDLATARLVAAAWSRVVWHGDSRKRDTPYNGWCLIRRVVSTRVPTGGGDELPPLLRNVSMPLVPTGQTALRRLGIETSVISELRDASPTFATSCLPLPVLLAFLPAPAWSAVAAVVGCDPDRDLMPRVHEALREHGRDASDARLGIEVQGLWVLFRHLSDLRRELSAENASRLTSGRPVLALPDSIERWVQVPKRLSKPELDRYGQGGTRQDRSAIPLPTVASALKTSVKETGWGRWSPEEWPPNRSWRALKRLAVLCVLLTGCPRITHLALLDVDDFDPVHTFEDGTTGPGLRFRRELMKSGGRGMDAYWKRLPDFVGDVLVAWIKCSGRATGQQNAPLFITQKVTNPGDPGSRYSCDTTIRAFVSGSSRASNQPLIPLPGSPSKGYTPHRFRNTMTQLVERLFADWKTHNPTHHLAAYAPHDVAEIAVDHKVDDLGYRDYKNRKRLEELLALVIDLVWTEAWGDGLQQRGLDPERISTAFDLVLFLEAELELLEQQIAQLEADDASALKRSQGATSEHAKLDALVDSQAVGNEIRQKLRRQLKLNDDLVVARSTLEQVMSVRVILPDDLEPEVHARKLADVLARIDGQVDHAPELIAVTPLAAELTTEDIAALYQCTATHVRRWRGGHSSPPVDPEHWIKYNEKDWRYPAAAIDASALARVPVDNPTAALDAIRRSRAVRGYGKRTQLSADSSSAALAASVALPPPTDASLQGSEERLDTSLASHAALAVVKATTGEAPRLGRPPGIIAEVLKVIETGSQGQIWTNADILEELTPAHPDATPEQLQESINGALARLTKQGSIKRHAHGQYGVLKCVIETTA